MSIIVLNYHLKQFHKFKTVEVEIKMIHALTESEGG